jgi:hypothetical protein
MPFNNKMRLEASMLLGGAGGVLSSGTQYGGTVIEPAVALRFRLGEQVGTLIRVGYNWLPSSPTRSSLVVGIRFEFDSEKDVLVEDKKG